MFIKAKLFIITFIIVTACMIGLAMALPYINDVFMYLNETFPNAHLANIKIDISSIDLSNEFIRMEVFFIVGLLLVSILFPFLSIVVPSRVQPDKEDVVLDTDKDIKIEEVLPIDVKAVQMLALLQKKGRLVDFLQEDISSYNDQQVGQAVRSIHQGCKSVLDEYIKIEPVINEIEGNDVTVKEGFDPSVIRLTGNVTGSAPFRGVLQHCGWRVSTTKIPATPASHDAAVIEPAEVEIT
ncbi:MAG: DUF2760 domain-containing protein [Candidatus Magnetoovum sp. WYHC-5]|nr:DUF2760 domain-containing protein [Candidatus Magnetoovum sp. WYHC-5]